MLHDYCSLYWGVHVLWKQSESINSCGACNRACDIHDSACQNNAQAIFVWDHDGTCVAIVSNSLRNNVGREFATLSLALARDRFSFKRALNMIITLFGVENTSGGDRRRAP